MRLLDKTERYGVEVYPHYWYSAKFFFRDLDVAFGVYSVGDEGDDLGVIEVLFVFEGFYIFVYREIWVLGEEHERKRMRRG